MRTTSLLALRRWPGDVATALHVSDQKLEKKFRNLQFRRGQHCSRLEMDGPWWCGGAALGVKRKRFWLLEKKMETLRLLSSPCDAFPATAQRERGGDRLPWSLWSIFRPPSTLAEPPMARDEIISIDGSRSSISGDTRRFRRREASRLKKPVFPDCKQSGRTGGHSEKFTESMPIWYSKCPKKYEDRGTGPGIFFGGNDGNQDLLSLIKPYKGPLTNWYVEEEHTADKPPPESNLESKSVIKSCTEFESDPESKTESESSSRSESSGSD
ncbi:hypothetical protein JCGZ_05223 [Jatropha curcas]|uniref:Uncharacterized protein n=1 Tax=Jatropha curcas TaxID=180498 RepID=A0A067KRZ9_JATCU|nr:hypothetical protein JCGZ_05223 [Jatropha curcas]